LGVSCARRSGRWSSMVLSHNPHAGYFGVLSG
jgi:hypothetical protein